MNYFLLFSSELELEISSEKRERRRPRPYGLLYLPAALFSSGHYEVATTGTAPPLYLKLGLSSAFANNLVILPISFSGGFLKAFLALSKA